VGVKGQRRQGQALWPSRANNWHVRVGRVINYRVKGGRGPSRAHRLEGYKNKGRAGEWRGGKLNRV